MAAVLHGTEEGTARVLQYTGLERQFLIDVAQGSRSSRAYEHAVGELVDVHCLRTGATGSESEHGGKEDEERAAVHHRVGGYSA